MRNRRKLIALTTLTILVLIAVSSNAEAKENSHFTPCQYKASYRYYMEKGEGYLKDNQLESALLSYERALIIQPNSEEAQLKIISVKEMIGGKKPAHVMQERTKALRRAIAFAEEVPEEERPSRQVVSSVSEEVYKPRPKRVYKPAPEHKLTPEPSTKEELSQPQQYPKRAATKEAVKQYPRPETVEKNLLK